ncbi:MAG: FxsA family protein [Alphaproteobacteria bacterium]
MFLKLFLFFAAIPFLELVILIKIGQLIGIAYTLLLIVITAAAGAFISKYQGLKILYNIKKDLMVGVMPTDEVIDGVIVLICGFLFLTPGILTDVAAFFGLIPYVRSKLKTWIKNKIKDFIVGGKTITVQYHSDNE